jgi:hypothetical protein
VRRNLDGSPDERREGEFSLDTSATPEDIQKANDKMWGSRTARSSAMDSAGQGGLSKRATPDSINAANRAFYAPQPTHRREWGKG